MTEPTVEDGPRCARGHVMWCQQCEQDDYREAGRRESWARWYAAWESPGPYALNGWGKVLHTADCHTVQRPGNLSEDYDDHYGAPESHPMSEAEAVAWLRVRHERRRCQVCCPGVPIPPWVKIGRRWRLADATVAPSTE